MKGFSAVLTDSVSKAFGDRTPMSFVPRERIVLGRGDTESVQLVFSCPEPCVLHLKLPEGMHAFIENYAVTRDGLRVPDALFPLSEDGTFDAEAGLGALWLTYSASEEMPAGDYTLPITLFCEEECLFSADLVAHVYDVTLPRIFLCESHTSAGKWDIAKKLGLSWEDYTAGNAETVSRVDEVYLACYELLLSYGISPGELPYPLTDARAKTYLDDERVKSFVLPWNVGEDVLSSWRSVLLEHPVWLKKALFYPVDEPMTMNHLNTLKERADTLHRIFPEACVVTPLHRDLQVDEERDTFAFLEGITDLWCPKAPLFSDYVYSEEQRQKYPPIAERMRARKRAGDRLWWYVCCEPVYPYANVQMTQDLYEARELFWQQAREEVDGFLYWSSTYWQNTEDEFTFAPHYLMGVTPIYGDGVLCYLDSAANPIPSIRLAAIRDGMRDFTLLTLLRQKNPEAYHALFAAFDTRIDRLVRDNDRFLKTREALYRALEQA